MNITAILPWKVKCANVYLTTVLSLIQDKMFFILVYLKTNPLQELHAIQFEMTQPQANRWIHLLSEILRRTLKTLGELPDRNSKRLIHILQGCEEVLLDGTERPIQRPLDEDWQSACYSGKKTHSIKNNLLCTNNLRIVWLSSTYKGHVHDKRFVMKNLFYFPKVLGSGRIQVSSDTNRMELKYACPKRNLKGKSLLVLKNKRTSGFPELGLKWSMP